MKRYLWYIQRRVLIFLFLTWLMTDFNFSCDFDPDAWGEEVSLGFGLHISILLAGGTGEVEYDEFNLLMLELSSVGSCTCFPLVDQMGGEVEWCTEGGLGTTVLLISLWKQFLCDMMLVGANNYMAPSVTCDARKIFGNNASGKSHIVLIQSLFASKKLWKVDTNCLNGTESIWTRALPVMMLMVKLIPTSLKMMMI